MQRTKVQQVAEKIGELMQNGDGMTSEEIKLKLPEIERKAVTKALSTGTKGGLWQVDAQTKKYSLVAGNNREIEVICQEEENSSNSQAEPTQKIMNNPTPTQIRKIKINLVDGEKGGVGKSLFCQLLVEWYLKQGIAVDVIDADRIAPNIGLIYKTEEYQSYLKDMRDGKTNERQIYFGGNYDGQSQEEVLRADKILASGLTSDVVINLPANVYFYVNTWLQQGIIPLLNDPDELEIFNFEVIKWFVTDGTDESLQDMFISLEELVEHVPHYIVINKFKSDKAEDQIRLDSRLKALQVQWGERIKILTIGKLVITISELAKIAAKNMSLSQATEFESQLNVLTRQRIKMFLKASLNQISTVIGADYGVLPEATSPSPKYTFAYGKAANSTEQKSKEEETLAEAPL